MSLTLVLPERYQYVALAGAATVFLTTWQTILVGGARRKAGIKYPQTSAEKAEMEANKDALTFNNIQRAHQNTLEQYPQLLLSMFITGLKYPTFAAATGAAWIIGRVFYTLNYRKSADKRYSALGRLALWPSLILHLSSAWTVASFFQFSLSSVREPLGL